MNLKTLPVAKNKVPDVRGMTAKDAVFILESLGMKVKIKGFGTVKKQSIAPKQEIIRGNLIEITLK